MQLEIKEATINELDEINILLKASKGHWGYDKSFMDNYMEKYSITEGYLNKNVVKTVYLGQELVAFYSFKLHEDSTLELERLYILPKYIGKGIGTKLWEACCNTAKDLDKNEFILWSDPHSEQFYYKMGCIKIGERQSPLMPNRFPSIFKFIISN